MGEPLTGDVSDIAYADGLDNASFSYQWMGGTPTSWGPQAPAIH